MTLCPQHFNRSFPHPIGSHNCSSAIPPRPYSVIQHLIFPAASRRPVATGPFEDPTPSLVCTCTREEADKKSTCQASVPHSRSPAASQSHTAVLTLGPLPSSFSLSSFLSFLACVSSDLARKGNELAEAADLSVPTPRLTPLYCLVRPSLCAVRMGWMPRWMEGVPLLTLLTPGVSYGRVTSIRR